MPTFSFFKVGNKSRLAGSGNYGGGGGGGGGQQTPSPRKTGSWRHAIFQQVKTPNQTCDSNANQARSLSREETRPVRTSQDYRVLWKKAIRQQILLVRMDKQNKRLRGEYRLFAHTRCFVCEISIMC